MATQKVLILDNGGYSIKAGFSGVDWEPRRVELQLLFIGILPAGSHPTR